MLQTSCYSKTRVQVVFGLISQKRYQIYQEVLHFFSDSHTENQKRVVLLSMPDHLRIELQKTHPCRHPDKDFGNTHHLPTG
ncbi:hypothetical protein ES705_44311 [subsurface metagenome]